MVIDIDNKIAEPETYADPETFHELFGWLRRNEPIRWTRPEGHRPFWTVSRYRDIMEIEKRSDVFHCAARTVLRTIEREDSVRRVTGSDQPMRSLMHMDEPDHRKYRALTQAWFMPAKLKSISDSLDQLAGLFVDRMAEAGDRCDFAEDIAARYTLRALMTIIGVPEQDEALMTDITQRFFSPADPSINKGRTIDIGSTLEGAFAYFTDLAARRRQEPRNDVATVLANAEIDGEPISDFDRNSYFFLLAIGGHDTTAVSLAGLMDALLSRPEQFARLRAEPQLLDTAIDEGIRWTSPAKHFMRTADADHEIGGTVIRRGEAVLLSYPSGNFDEEAFDEPHEFRIDRSPNRHLGFGFGVHHCLGNHLARLEMRALWRELLRRVETVERAGETQRLVSTFVSGITSLPISYRMRLLQPA
ncbi:cytochrome P450 [Streptomyces malaysiensis]|uniref:cytochrome P450 n=1 Tax=Streptomyces malaysiensis TaxID=92644 RepID=UPI002B2C9124|nr:cytochrome P450 [Streptomyces malaysiensis]